MNKQQAQSKKDELLKEIAELDKLINQPEVSAEQRFLDMWNGCTIYLDPQFPDSVFLMKDGKVWFEQDFKSGYLWCHYYKVWMIFSEEYNMRYQAWQEFVKNLVEKRFKLKGLTPNFFYPKGVL